MLAYTAGGAGAAGLPGSAAWNVALGRHWSHSYAERILEDPDESHVWLITRLGTFREFTDTDADSVYDAVAPSDEYRTLEWLGAGLGWELRDLDGTVQSFRDDGLWTQTVDRNGNATVATYSRSQLTGVSFPDGRSEMFGYHPSGKLATITEVGVGVTDCGVDPAGCLTWSYTWTGDDLFRIDRPDGTAWELIYGDGSWPGYLTRMELVGTDTSRRIEGAWEYDAHGNVISTWKGALTATDSAAVDQWAFSFDDPADPTVTTVTDPLGAETVYTLDRDPVSRKPRVLSISGDCPQCGLGSNAELFYDDADNPLLPTRQIDGNGNDTLFEYNENGRMTQRTEAAGTNEARTTAWEYDAAFPAFPTLIVQPSVAGAAARTTAMVYDGGTGDLQTRSIAGGEESAPGGSFSLVTAYTYNAAGQPLTINPPGYTTTDVTTFVYPPGSDPRGGLYPDGRIDPIIGQTSFAYDVFNRRAEVTDVNQVTTATEYDSLDRVTRIVQEGATPAEDLVTEQVYSSFGDLFRTVLPAGNVIEYGYDGAGRLVSIERKPDAATPGERTFYVLNDAGNRIREEQERWDGSQWLPEAVTDFVYTSRCHVERVVQAPGTPEESVTEYAYDCNGNLEKAWDANHPSAGQAATPTTTYGYDALDRMISVSQPWQGGGDAVTAYGYDAQDHLTEVTDAEGNVTTYEYSDRDLLTREFSPVWHDGVQPKSATHRYNPHGELVQTVDPRGVTVGRTVDALDRVTFIDYPGTSLDSTYTYDDALVPFAKGRLTRISRVGATIDYRYDRFGRVTQDGALSYEHDKNGRRTSVTYPLGPKAISTFDFADRPATLTLEADALNQPLVTAASYRLSGPLASLTLGNGLVETREFDQRYIPTSIAAGSLLDWSYQTDGVGNVVEIADGGGPARTYAYQDVQYFLTQGDGPWGTRSWTYDRIGNRLSETRGAVTDTYDYFPAGPGGTNPRLETLAVGGGGGTRTYGYDAAGNQTSITGALTRTFIYNDESRLLQVDPGAVPPRSRFGYDGRGFLAVGRLEPGAPGLAGITAATYSSDGRLHHHRRTVTGGTPPPPHHSYVFYFGDRPVALGDATESGGVPTGFEVTYLTTDHLGTPALATTQAGAELWQGGFEPFGADFSGAQAAGVFLRFLGQWQDPAWEHPALSTGLYYNVHRWYAHGTGRYSRPDPFGIDGGGPNVYAYALHNPLLYTDPLGQAVITQGCDSADAARIQSAAGDADSAAQTCLPCPSREPFRKTIRGDLVVRCDYFPMPDECAATNRQGEVVIYPKGLTRNKPSQCGCLQSLILHEVLHLIGFGSEDDILDQARKCFGCAQQRPRVASGF